MVEPARAFLDVARCEDVYTSSSEHGRSPAPQRQRKHGKRAQLHIRIDAATARRWKAKAAILDITLSDLVRAQMDGTAIKVARVTDPALYRELRRQGLNLNQLTHAAHDNILVERARLDATLDALRRLYAMILREYA